MDLISNLFGTKTEKPKPKPKSDIDKKEGKLHHPTKTRPTKPKRIPFSSGEAYRDYNVDEVKIGGRKDVERVENAVNLEENAVNLVKKDANLEENDVVNFKIIY